MAAIGDLVSFEPDRVEVTLDGKRLQAEPGQNVVSHGVDRDLTSARPGRSPRHTLTRPRVG